MLNALIKLKKYFQDNGTPNYNMSNAFRTLTPLDSDMDSGIRQILNEPFDCFTDYMVQPLDALAQVMMVEHGLELIREPRKIVAQYDNLPERSKKIVAYLIGYEANKSKKI